MELKDMSRDERSLLLYLECRMVDHFGKVDTRHMNTTDMAIAERWNDEGFIGFGRICMADIQSAPSKCSHWVEFSEEAWRLAHEERRARYERNAGARTWKKTEEVRNAE